MIVTDLQQGIEQQHVTRCQNHFLLIPTALHRQFEPALLQAGLAEVLQQLVMGSLTCCAVYRYNNVFIRPDPTQPAAL